MTDPLQVFAESVRGQFRKRDREIAELQREIAELRNELAVERRLAEVMQRLDRLEAAPRSRLRAVSP